MKKIIKDLRPGEDQDDLKYYINVILVVSVIAFGILYCKPRPVPVMGTVKQ